MTDSFSLGDKKTDTKITENVGKSPLEQSIHNSGNQKEAGQDVGQTSPATGDVSNMPSVEPASPAPSQPLTPQDKPAETPSGPDLPAGVKSAPPPGADNSQTPPPVSNLPDKDVSTPPVLQEKPQDIGKGAGQSSTQTQDPAILDALKQEPETTPSLKANVPEPKPKPDLPPPEQPKTEQDFGEPSKAPDTDEFLKSILDDKTGMPEGSAPPPEETLPKIPPTQNDQNPVLPPEPQPPTTDLSNELNTMEQRETPPSVNAPKTTSLSEKSPIDGQGIDVNQNKNRPGGASIDSISSSEPSSAEGDDMLNANRPKAKSSSLKIILAVFLAVVVVVIGYYVYTVLFPAQDISAQPGRDENLGEIDYTTGLETEFYATDDEQRKADLAKIEDALLNYYAGQGQFPIVQSLTLLTAGNILETELVPAFLDSLPTDPSTAKLYGYKSDGTTFTLTAILDDPDDPEVVIEDNQAVYSLIYDSAKTSASGSAASALENENNTSSEATFTGED